MKSAWKFHDYEMLLNCRIMEHGEIIKCPVAYRLTNLNGGSACLVYRTNSDTGWTRKTKNDGSKSSVRYVSYPNLDAALLAGIAWARRKDEERAKEEKACTKT